MEIKSISAEGAVKDVDIKTNTVTGFFSVFGNIDHDNDVIVPGAFKKSLQESKRQLHLYQHDSFRPLSSVKSGKLILKEDSYGLNFESTISPTSWGKDVIQLYQDGVLNEHSIGFTTIKAADKKSYRELIELRLYEGSSVSFGANPLAQTSAKGLFTIDRLEKKMDSVMRAIRSGKYENEEIFDSLEIYFKQLTQLFISTKSTAPVPESTVKPEDNKEAVLMLREINKSFSSF